MNTPILLSVGIALLLQCCSYAISPDISRQTDKTVSFEQLQSDPSPVKGKIVIFGGTIVQTRNLKSGTMIEVAQKELDYWGKPRRTDKTGGRFLALHPGYLDAMVYAPGRDVTIAGEVTGEEESLDTLGTRHPLLAAKEIRLWERQQPGPGKPMWMDRLYDPDAPGSRYGY